VVGFSEEEEGGYLVELRAFDAGEYHLHVSLLWFYGDHDYGDVPIPTLVSDFMGYSSYTFSYLQTSNQAVQIPKDAM